MWIVRLGVAAEGEQTMRTAHAGVATLWILVIAGTTACDEPIRLLPQIESFDTHQDTWIQEQEDYSDILIVVDSSASMSDEQQLLGNSFNAFTEFIRFAETDFHMGVITADTGTDNPLEEWLPVVNAGVLRGEPSFITSDTPNGDLVFRAAVNVGTNGSGLERGFEAAQTALSPPLVFEQNQGFYREEALLNVVFVSDEDDQSGGSVMDWERWFYELKGFQAGTVTFHGLVGVDNETGNAEPCGEGDPFEGGAVAAVRYAEIIRNSLGIAGSICEPNFNTVLREIGRATTGIKDRFLLSERPEIGTGVLTLAVPDTPEYIQGGFDVPAEGREGEWPWTIERDIDGWWLQFTDTASLPPGEARIQFGYVISEEVD
jgi:hypothetical protein